MVLFISISKPAITMQSAMTIDEIWLFIQTPLKKFGQLFLGSFNP
ncbi:hypothetical protein HMPREF9374_3509 [Desmospora sp. 8437]|nr:hypothetical protein HMPREF9374_3509 [Desmospora sp. 8437]